MARFPIYQTEQTISGRPSAVRASLDVSSGGTAIAEAVSGAGTTIFEISQRKEQMDDVLTRNSANQIKEMSENAIKEYRAKQPDTRLWAEHSNKIFDAAVNNINQLKASNKMTQIIQSETSAWRSVKSGEFDIEEIEKKKKDTLEVLINDYINAYTSGDPLNIKAADSNFKTSIKGIVAPANAEIIRKNAVATGIKSYWKSQAELFPERTISKMNTELEARRSGKGTISEEIIPSDEIGDIIGYANTAIGRKNGELELQRERDRDILGNELYSGTLTYEKINNTSLDEKEQESYRLKMNTESERRAKGEPIITNQLIKGDLESQAYKIWQGAITKTEFDKQLNAARYGEIIDGKLLYSFGDVRGEKPFIDDVSYDQLRTLGTKELQTSQAKGLTDSIAYGKEQLVDYAEEPSWIMYLQGLKDKERKIAQSQRQIQLDNWRQFNESMKLWQSLNADAVESDYRKEARRKMPFYRSRANEEITKNVPPEISEKEKRRQRYLELKAKAEK